MIHKVAIILLAWYLALFVSKTFIIAKCGSDALISHQLLCSPHLCPGDLSGQHVASPYVTINKKTFLIQWNSLSLMILPCISLEKSACCYISYLSLCACSSYSWWNLVDFTPFLFNSQFPALHWSRSLPHILSSKCSIMPGTRFAHSNYYPICQKKSITTMEEV